MLIAAHAIAAGTVGTYISNPILAFLLGIILHFVLDFVPHYDTTDEGKFTPRQIALILTDFLLFLLIIIFVIKPSDPSFWWGAFGGIFPDFLDINPLWNKAFRKTAFGKSFHKFHEKIQRYRASFVPGISVQMLVILISLWMAK